MNYVSGVGLPWPASFDSREILNLRIPCYLERHGSPASLASLQPRCLWDNVDRPDFQCSTCLLADDYRGEVATLSEQVANLHNLRGTPPLRTFSFSSTPVAGRLSGMVDVSPPGRLSTANWLALCRDPSPKGSPPSLENGDSRMLLEIYNRLYSESIPCDCLRTALHINIIFNQHRLHKIPNSD